MAKSNRLDLTAVPSYETGAWRVAEKTGEALTRCFAVPVANAIMAGATELSIGVSRDGNELVVEVADDPGGYEPSDDHLGRGLDVLGHELGEGSVTALSAATEP